jgi:hypothetical protein
MIARNLKPAGTGFFCSSLDNKITPSRQLAVHLLSKPRLFSLEGATLEAS